MIVYSEKIGELIGKIKFILKNILTQEVKLKVRGDRFYDKTGRYSYPVKIVIFNHGNKLGYFDADFLELGFHESVFFSSNEELSNLIRHEIAHYLTYIEYGGGFFPHGREFRSVCMGLNWGKEVYAAKISLEESPSLNKSSISRKIEKLLALSSSSNTHESTSALIKSRELLLKHNMERSFENKEQIYLKRIIKSKRKSAKMEAIAHILETFFVSTIFNSTKEYVYLEIIGSAVNTEIAEYIGATLDIELERLWALSGLKGVTEKNSFFLGIAKGYFKKMQDLKNQYSQETTGALMVIENQLTLFKSILYPHLSQSKSFRKHSPTASSLGELIGKSLEFKKGIKQAHKTSFLLP
jgi:hypothetical protein